jgi:hypothetical protein
MSNKTVQRYDVAKANYLVEGLSGTGKSSVYKELTRRGYSALSTDRIWAHILLPPRPVSQAGPVVIITGSGIRLRQSRP